MSIELAILFIVCAVLLLASGGLFAAAEAALSVSSRADLMKIAHTDGRADKALRKIAENEAPHVAAASFARVIAEALAAALITTVLIKSIENLWLALAAATAALLVATFFLVGASPRRIGVLHPAATLRFLAGLLVFNRAMLGPITGILNRFSSKVALRRETSQEHQAESVLLSLVDRAAEDEVLEADDREIIHSVIKLGDTRVRQTMTPRADMVTTPATATMRAGLEALLASRHSRMPVIADDADEVLGVLHLRDAAGFVLRYPDEADTALVTRMMKQARFVPDLMYADDLLKQMQQENSHLALTVDEYGGISGLVTFEDLLEELIGDIYDEHDREDTEAQQLADGSFEVSPRLAVTELGELFAIELDDEEVDTVGGLIVKELGRLADSGESIVVAGIKLTASEVDRRGTINQITAVWVGGNTDTEDTHD